MLGRTKTCENLNPYFEWMGFGDSNRRDADLALLATGGWGWNHIPSWKERGEIASEIIWNRNILGPAQTLGFFLLVLVNQTLAHNKWIGVIWGLRKPWFTVAKYNHHDFTRRPLSCSIDPLKISIWTRPKKSVFENRDFMGFLVVQSWNSSQFMFNQPTPPKNVTPSETKGFHSQLS